MTESGLKLSQSNKEPVDYLFFLRVRELCIGQPVACPGVSVPKKGPAAFGGRLELEDRSYRGKFPRSAKPF